VNKKKWLVIAVVVLAVIASAALYETFINNDVKTSVVKEIHIGGSGCSQLELENGDNVDTFCFWTPPEKQPKYDRSIKVGDTVEYGVESDRQFIRLKK
jgi:hypothetical protein